MTRLNGQGSEAFLRETLAFAVPLWIERFLRTPWEVVQERAERASELVAEKGDLLLFGDKHKRAQGQTAEAFNALAAGLACLSFAKGGVDFLGLHFEARHPLALHSSYWRDPLCDET